MIPAHWTEWQASARGVEYAGRPEHSAVEAIGRMMGVPDDCAAVVTCVDCGKRAMAAHCSWRVNRKTCRWTGPHCGCTQNMPAGVNSHNMEAAQ